MTYGAGNWIREVDEWISDSRRAGSDWANKEAAEVDEEDEMKVDKWKS